MLTKKKKLSKKEIKQDKLVETYYKAYSYFDENRSRILLYAGILVVIVLAAIYYINNKKEKNAKAEVLLSQVMNLYDQGSYLEAIEGRPSENIVGLRKIVEDFGNTENGETAKIYLANSYQMLGKEDEAFKYYDDYDGSISIYKATALAGKASYYAGKKEYEKAAGLFKEASRISKDDVLNPDYMLNAAINYLHAGKSDEAKDLLNSIRKGYPASQANTQVDKYLALVE
jgi:tetratricopeptide (TPR) repeat protein